MKNMFTCEFDSTRMGFKPVKKIWCLCKLVQFGQPRPQSHFYGGYSPVDRH